MKTAPAPGEDDQTASATRVPVEVPGADGDHALANVLNAAIDFEHTHQQLGHDGTMIVNAAVIKANDALRVATRAYLQVIE